MHRSIIPDEVKLSSTIRTFSADIHQDIEHRIHQTIEYISTGASAVAEVQINYGYPVTIKDPNLAMSIPPHWNGFWILSHKQIKRNYSIP